jgi:hypothetical protein
LPGRADQNQPALTTALYNIGTPVIKLPDMHRTTTHTVTSIVSFLVETTVTVRNSEYRSRLKDAQTLWVRLPACGQGCQIGFLEAKFQKYVFFFKFGWRHKIHLAFFLAFLHAKIICTKITCNLFSKSFSFKKNAFWPVAFGNISAAKILGKKAPATNR